MKMIALLLLLPALSVSAQGLTTLPPGGAKKYGPLITPDANVVTHIYFNGKALIDTKSKPWAMVGTVPQVAALTTLFKRPVAGAGAFSSANHYALASTNVLQFSGDFTVCVIWKAATVGNQRLVVASDMSTKGWLLNQSNGGNITMYTGTGSALTGTATAAGYTANTVSIGCFGRAGGKSYVKGNGQASNEATLAYSPASSSVAYLGDIPAASIPLTGTLFEMYATTTAWNETTVAAIQAAVIAKAK